MRLHSTYCGTCPCGKTFETEATELTCSKCGRKLVIEWTSNQAQPAKVEAPKVTPINARRVA